MDGVWRIGDANISGAGDDDLAGFGGGDERVGDCRGPEESGRMDWKTKQLEYKFRVPRTLPCTVIRVHRVLPKQSSASSDLAPRGSLPRDSSKTSDSALGALSNLVLPGLAWREQEGVIEGEELEEL